MIKMIAVIAIFAMLLGAIESKSCGSLIPYSNGSTLGFYAPGFEDSVAHAVKTFNGPHNETYQAFNGTTIENLIITEAPIDGQWAAMYEGCTAWSFWGGFQDWFGLIPMTENSLHVPFSVSKWIFDKILTILEGLGYFEWDEKVAYYWPAFAQNGKQDITVRQLFSNAVLGLQAFQEYYDISDISATDYNHTLLRRLCEESIPVANPGQYYAYSTVNRGVFAEEFIIIVSGKNISQWLDIINKKIGTNFHIGIRPWEATLLALQSFLRIDFVHPTNFPIRKDPLYFSKLNATFYGPDFSVARNDTLQGRSYSPITNLNPFLANTNPNLYIPAAGIFANAKDLAKLAMAYADKGKVNGKKVFEKGAIKRSTKTEYNGTDHLFVDTQVCFQTSGDFCPTTDMFQGYNQKASVHFGTWSSWVVAVPKANNQGPNCGAWGAAYVTSMLELGSDREQLGPTSSRLSKASLQIMCNHHNSLSSQQHDQDDQDDGSYENDDD